LHIHDNGSVDTVIVQSFVWAHRWSGMQYLWTGDQLLTLEF